MIDIRHLHRCVVYDAAGRVTELVAAVRVYRAPQRVRVLGDGGAEVVNACHGYRSESERARVATQEAGRVTVTFQS